MIFYKIQIKEINFSLYWLRASEGNNYVWKAEKNSKSCRATRVSIVLNLPLIQERAFREVWLPETLICAAVCLGVS